MKMLCSGFKLGPRGRSAQMNPFSYFVPHLQKTLNKAILTTNMFTGKCGICGDMPPKGDVKEADIDGPPTFLSTRWNDVGIVNAAFVCCGGPRFFSSNCDKVLLLSLWPPLLLLLLLPPRELLLLLLLLLWWWWCCWWLWRSWCSMCFLWICCSWAIACCSWKKVINMFLH